MTNSRELYQRMKSEMDFSPVLKTIMREMPETPREKIETWMDAFLQWFSLIPNTTVGEPIQMLKTVDRVWHAFILNTKFYRQFCQTYIGCYVDHDPLDAEDGTLPKKAYAQNTLRLLEQHFGNEISPPLLFLHEEATCCLGCSDQYAIRIDVTPIAA